MALRAPATAVTTSLDSGVAIHSDLNARKITNWVQNEIFLHSQTLITSP